MDNIEIVDSQMGWNKVLEKANKAKRQRAADNQPEVDCTQKPPYVAKKMYLCCVLIAGYLTDW